MILASTPRGVVRLRDELLHTWQNYGHLFVSQTYANLTSPQGEFVSLERSELLWVSADMCHLLNTAEKSFPVETILREDDLPSDFGFVVFEETLSGLDAVRTDDEPIHIRAMAWALARVEGKFAIHLSFYVDSNRYGHVSSLGHLAYAGSSEWFFDTAADYFFPEIYEPRGLSAQALESIVEDRRRIASLLMLLHQPLVVEGIAKAGRQERRDAERRGREAPDVRILTLREIRRDHDDVEHRPTNWSHRWLVSGHWRNQWYATEQVHRPIWIAPFIKGPSEKELFIRPTVRAWRR
jgi:hypothetical protein